MSFSAVFGKINAPMSMDVSTGDVITPGAAKHAFSDILEDGISFELWSYPIETVLAEKIETILSRGIDNTRPRDFYDTYKDDLPRFQQATDPTKRSCRCYAEWLALYEESDAHSWRTVYNGFYSDIGS